MNNFFPRKSLGQNFLTDKHIKTKIIAACQLNCDDNVLEIGPGKGILTQDIVTSVKSLIAVEKDKKLFEYLGGKFKDCKNLTLVNDDILKFKLKQNNTKVIGNIPYNISSPLIEHLINQKNKISAIYISLQKEFAERLVANPGSKVYGAFSLFVQYHTEPQIRFFIKKGSFHPVPKVDSAFVELKVRETPAVKVKKEELLFKIIRAAFNQRRKMISNTLKRFLSSAEISKTGIKPNKRPEELSIEDFAKIEEVVVVK